MGRVVAILDEGTTCWRIAQANRAAFLIDGQDYFAALASALRQARRQVLILGWGFDTRTRLTPEADQGQDLGDFLIGLTRARPELDVRVLIWRSALAVSATQEFFPHRARGRFSGTAVKFRLDDKTPFGACHHQKVIVIDDHVAFCGSSDLGPDRWDTPAHLDRDARRRGPGGGDERPRHEVMAVVEGPMAAALGDLARERWRRSGDPRPIEAPGQVDGSAWPELLRPDLTDATCGVARTEPKWRSQAGVSEVTALSLAAIAAAKRVIYLENQYFASPVIAEALAGRLSEPDGPEVVLVTTQHSASYFDRLTMDRMRSVLLWRLRAADVFGRFRAYSPVTTGGQTIIVHAKIMIIDDILARIGSANINNRSGGFDTECDMAFDATDAAGRAAVTGLMDTLAGHWVARPREAMTLARERFGGLAGALEALNTHGRLLTVEPVKLGPFGEFVSAFHLGDPANVSDSWRPARRRDRIYARVRAVREAADKVLTEEGSELVGG
jgi:phosphatidylserine/phosphatidylglycerophosphate/cardiolipin synthase-like enzyme